MRFDDNHTPLAISVSETARQLGVGRTTVYGLINSGQLKTTKIGRRRLISMLSVREFLGQPLTNGGVHA